MKWIEYLAAHLTPQAKDVLCAQVAGVSPRPEQYRIVVQSKDSSEEQVQVEVFDDNAHALVAEHVYKLEEFEGVLEDAGTDVDGLCDTYTDEQRAIAKQKKEEEEHRYTYAVPQKAPAQEIDATPQVAETLQESLEAMVSSGQAELKKWSEELARRAAVANASGDPRLPVMVANQAQAIMGAYGISLARGISQEIFAKVLTGLFRMLVLRLPVALFMLAISLSLVACGSTGTIPAVAIQPITHDVCDVHDQLVQESPVLTEAQKEIYLGNSEVLRLTVDKAASETE